MNVNNPTNPIVQDAPVEVTPIILPPGKDKPIVQPIYNSTTINVLKNADASNPVVMIAVVATIICVIIVGGIIGYFMYRRYTSNLIARKGQHTSTPVDQSSRANMTPASPEVLGDDFFEDQYQYQPNAAVIDIFGRGNDIIKKGNEADAIEEAIKEDPDEDLSSSERGDHLSSGEPPQSVEGGSNGRTGSGGSNQNTTRNLVTNARESTLNENMPLSTFNSQPQNLIVRQSSRRGEIIRATDHVDPAAYSSAQRRGVAGRAPPTFNDEGEF